MAETPSSINAPFATGDFQRKYIYRQAPRRNRSIETIRFYELGHMLETLVDLLHLNLVLPQDVTIFEGDPTLHEPHQAPPALPLAIFDDYRKAPSFFREDKHVLNPFSPAKASPVYGVSKLANDIHGMLRSLGSKMGKQIIFPTSLDPLIEAYSAEIRTYQKLVEKHGSFEKIPAPEMEAYNTDLVKAITPLKAALMTTPSVSFVVGGGTYEVPNTAPVNPRLAESFPAMVLFHLSRSARDVANQQRVPLKVIDFNNDAIGVESLITDTMRGLARHAMMHNPDLMTNPDFDFNRKRLGESITDNVRDLKLLYHFHRLIGRSYEMAFNDLALFLEMVGQNTDLPPSLEPREIGLLAYGLSKGLERHAPTALPDADYAGRLNARAEDYGLYTTSESQTRLGLLLNALSQKSLPEPYNEALCTLRQAVYPNRTMATSAHRG